MENICPFLMALAFFAGCKDEPSNPEHLPEPSINITLEPAFGVVGDKIKITCFSENMTEASSSLLYYYLWEDRLELRTMYDSAENNIIYAFIPYISWEGPYDIYVGQSYNDSLYIASAKLEVAGYSGLGIYVIKSDEPGLTEEETYFYQPKFMDGSEWQTEVKGDTVIIWRQIREENGCLNLHKIIFLDKGTALLPELIDYEVHTKCISSDSFQNTVHLANGLVKIDKWQPGELYAGIIYCALEPYSLPNKPSVIRFWGKL